MATKIEGLEELLKVLEGTSLTTSFKKASVGFSKEVQSNLLFLTNARYAISKAELEKSFLGSSETLSDNALTVQLNYQHNPTNLGARYSYKGLGNLIGQGEKKRTGWLHLVEVRRGAKRVSRGKYRYGGFIPAAKGIGRKGKYMYERTTQARYPIVPILTLSAAQATEQVFLKDKDFDNYLSLLGDKLVSKISETLF